MAMDAKEVMRLAVQHRFWITIGVATVMIIVAPLVTLGSINEQIAAKTSEIKGAKSGADKYANGSYPNNQYPAYTEKRIADIQSDVDTSHRDLYGRQAPLLDWPPNVKAEFQKWGRVYPKEELPNYIREVAYDYTRGYDDFVKNIYKSFKPWDPVEGTGLVVAPPEEMLLEKQTFDINDPPTLTKIWTIQDNLWVRGAILDVIARVNDRAGAKDWETAPIKKINSLTVGTRLALDHEAVAKGTALKDPAPLEPADATASSSPSSTPAPSGDNATANMEGFMSSQGAMGSSSGGMGAAGAATKIQYLQPDGVDQFRDYPAVISVLIDQNYIQEFLAQFENSPMSIRVREVNWNRPTARVKPPVKGEALGGFGGMGGYGMGMGGGFFGEEGMSMMGSGGMMSGARGGMMSEGMMGGMMPGGGRGGLGAVNQPRTKIDRDEALKKSLESKKGTPDKKEDEDKKKGTKVEIFDPYYNVVELQVYTRARFYSPPPPATAETEAPASPGDAPPAEGEAVPAEGEATPAEGEAAPTEAAPAEGEAGPTEAAPAEGDPGTPAPDASAAPVGEPATATPPAPAEGAPPAGESGDPAPGSSNRS